MKRTCPTFVAVILAQLLAIMPAVWAGKSGNRTKFKGQTPTAASLAAELNHQCQRAGGKLDLSEGIESLVHDLRHTIAGST